MLTTFDRAALAAYCQAWGRWVEAEERLRETPPLVKTPSGYVQQSPWLTIANKQLELMGRYMVELGLTPAARSRLGTSAQAIGVVSAGADPDHPHDHRSAGDAERSAPRVLGRMARQPRRRKMKVVPDQMTCRYTTRAAPCRTELRNER